MPPANSPATPFDVFCYGEIDIDNFIEVPYLPSFEKAAFARQDIYNTGGAAANTGVWLANWGVTVRLSGNALGQDAYGDMIMGWLAAHPTLDTRFIDQMPDVITPICRCLVTPDGERAFLLYWLTDLPIRPLTEEMLSGARCLALDLSGPVGPRLEAARLASRMGIPIVINDTWQTDHPILALADTVVISGAAVREQAPDLDLRERTLALHKVGGAVVVVSDGPRPVYAIDRDGSIFTAVPPAVRTVDGTGAGDSFKAGMIYGNLQGWPLAQTLAWAIATGALKVGRAGATAQPATIEEVAALAATIAASRL